MSKITITDHAKYQIHQMAKWMKVNYLHNGGTATTKNWLAFKFSHQNDSATIAMIAVDFQNKN